VPLHAGDVIGVEFRGSKGRFSVAWVGEEGTIRKGQIGIRSLEPGKCIWTAALDLAAKSASDSLVVSGDGHSGLPHEHGVERRTEDRRRQERRLHPRYKCSGGAEFRAQGASVRVWGNLSDVSQGGCYAEMMSPLAAGSEVAAVLTVGSQEVHAAGIVRVCHPGCGMGVEFTRISPEHSSRLERAIARLTAEADAATQTAGTAAAAAPDSISSPVSQPGFADSALQSLLLFFGEKDSLSREEFQKVLERTRAMLSQSATRQ